LSDLIGNGVNENELKQSVKVQNLTPLDRLPNAAKLLAWLIVSHHRLPNFSHSIRETRKEWLGVKSESIEVLLQRINQEW
ncbi:hypothetical protein ACKI1O_53125, partial [Streptomyces scabiei]